MLRLDGPFGPQWFSRVKVATTKVGLSQAKSFGADFVMTVRLDYYFLSPTLFPLPYSTTDTLPSLLVNALSWTYLLTPRQRQDALRTVRPSPYLLHASPSPPLYYLRVHQYLLMCTLCARISSPLPYVSLHLLCTLPGRLTCVVPRPLYAFS